ncbi:hypothetical protein ABIB25_003186 [Nakamurella sp. UYEF19]
MSSKNKGGREAKKPKQVKKTAGTPDTSPVAKAIAPRKAK